MTDLCGHKLVEVSLSFGHLGQVHIHLMVGVKDLVLQALDHHGLEVAKPDFGGDTLSGDLFNKWYLFSGLGAHRYDLSVTWIDLHDIDTFEQVLQEGERLVFDQTGDHLV